jgi:hypothetical protein
LFARLGIGLNEQGKGLGLAFSTMPFCGRPRQSDILGSPAILTQTKDEKAKTSYTSSGLEPSLTNQFHHDLLMQDITTILADGMK